MNDILAARSQMAMSLAFHIIYAVIGIGMPGFDVHCRMALAADERRILI